MRWILRLVLVLVLVFTGLWALARHQLLVAADGFLARQAVLGGGGRASAGLSPLELKVTLHDLLLVDPDTGTRLTSPIVQLSAPTYQPWHLSARSNSAVFEAAQTVTWTASDAEARLVITPGPDLALHKVRIDGIDWHFASDRHGSFGFGWLTAAMTNDDGTNRYHLLVNIADLTPDPGLSAALSPIGLSGPMTALVLDSHLTFAAPLDRHLGPTGPQLTAMALNSLAMSWGRAAISARGRLEADQLGLAMGEVTLDITHHQDLIAAAFAIGLISADQAGFLGKGLAAYADPARPEVVKVPFKLADGMVKLGPFPLGPAPRLKAP